MHFLERRLLVGEDDIVEIDGGILLQLVAYPDVDPPFEWEAVGALFGVRPLLLEYLPVALPEFEKPGAIISDLEMHEPRLPLPEQDGAAVFSYGLPLEALEEPAQTPCRTAALPDLKIAGAVPIAAEFDGAELEEAEKVLGVGLGHEDLETHPAFVARANAVPSDFRTLGACGIGMQDGTHHMVGGIEGIGHALRHFALDCHVVERVVSLEIPSEQYCTRPLSSEQEKQAQREQQRGL